MDAQVTLTYVLDAGETITVPKTVPASGRLTVNIETEDDARLHNAAVATVVSADRPTAVERSMYWNASGAFWAGGTNAVARRLP